MPTSAPPASPPSAPRAPSTALKGLLIDLDGTFYEYERCNRAGLDAALLALAEAGGHHPKDVEAHFHLSRQEVKRLLGLTASSHSRLLYFKHLVERLHGRTDPRLTIEMERRFWDGYFAQMALYPGIKHLLEEARRRGLKVAVVTNLTAHIQLRKLIHLGVEGHIDRLITSEEVGHEKPSRLIFEHALAQLGLGAHEVAMLGDDAHEDVAGARAVGIRALHLPKGFLAHPKDFDELLAALDRA